MPSTLGGGEILNQGEQLTSPNGQVVLSVQGDGNVVIFINGDPVWSTGSQINPGDTCYLQLFNGGDLQLRDPAHNIIWQSYSGAVSPIPTQLMVQDNGTVVIQAGGVTVWTQPTTPTPATTFQVVCTGPDGNVLYEQDYAYDDSGGTPGGAAAPTARWKLTSEKWADDKLKPVPAPQGVEAALAVAQFAWEFIKDNEPVTTIGNISTSVLSQEDTNPLHYQGAQDGQSGTYTWTGIAAVLNVTQWRVSVNLMGQYAATPIQGSPAPAGYYIPSVSTNASCSVWWPYSINATANVTSPSNVGTGTVIAQVNVNTVITASSFLDNFTLTINFRANGTRGFTLLSVGG